MIGPSYDSALSHQETLSAEEERRLSQRWRSSNDEQALSRLVNAHLRLVVSIARKFFRPNLSLSDLIQDGNVGLVIAAQRFDPDRHIRLASYASYWIRAYMFVHIVRNHGPVRIGAKRSERKIFYSLGRARRRLEREGRQVDPGSLAAVLGVDRDDVVAMLPRMSSDDPSLDASISDNDAWRSFGVSLADEAPSPEDCVASLEESGRLRARLRRALKTLDRREREIIMSRHMSQRPATLEILAGRLAISRERVRQIETRAKQKLRQHCGDLKLTS